MTSKAKRYDEMRQAVDDAEDAKYIYLTAMGWIHTSEATPGCYWVWIKDTERWGRLMGDTDTAIKYQENMGAYGDDQ